METVTVKQIHESFDLAADSLVNAANVYIVNYNEKLTAICNETHEEVGKIKHLREDAALAIPFNRKANRLKLLGFTGTKEVVEFAQLEKQERDTEDRIWRLERETVEIHNRKVAALKDQKKEFDQILYYKEKYPFLKFITDDQMNGICRKYNLVYSDVSDYIGEVPDKNLKEIENAKINNIDLRSNIYHYEMNDIDRGYLSFDCNIRMGERDVKKYAKELGYDWVQINSISGSIKTNYESLYIAAPKPQFKNLKQKKERGFGFFTVKKIEMPDPKDPIVFKFVKGGILIISKWGEEANDPALTVPELN
jgi:hypothetical protein